MWYMPSYGRPQALRTMLEAPGGWPDTVTILINEDDPERERYFQVRDALFAERGPLPFVLHPIPAGSRCADAYRVIDQRWPTAPFYGVLDDDLYPITPGWHTALEQAAGGRFISLAGGEKHFPLLRNARCMGGELARAMGGICPVEGLKHNYTDCIWDTVAADFGVLRPCPDFIVEHRHWIRGEANKDLTYEHGSHDIDQDRKVFIEWLRSQARADMSQRIGKLLEVRGVTTLDPRTVRLAICVPIGDEHVDIAYHKSLNATIIELGRVGISTKIIETTGGSHIGKARERPMWEAMHSFNPTHLFWVDDDMGWNPKQLIRLICSEHEFAAIAGVRKSDDLRVCCNFFPKEERHPVTGFLKIRDVGFAFVVMKTSVIEKMCKAYPELEYNAGDKREWALFLDMIDETRERLSEDFSFCNRWRKIGGEIWCDDEASIIHAGRKEYTGSVAEAVARAKSA